jgi:hypothetical protein
MNRLFDYRRLRIVPTAFLVMTAAASDLASRLLPRATPIQDVSRDVARLLRHRTRLRELRNQRSAFMQPR